MDQQGGQIDLNSIITQGLGALGNLFGAGNNNSNLGNINTNVKITFTIYYIFSKINTIYN